MRWQDYIEVEDGPDAEAIRKALDEIASTPEGQEYIERAVENLKESLGDPDAKIRIGPSDGLTAAYTNGNIRIGDAESIVRYEGADGNFHDLSMQRLLFHEIAHFAIGGKPPNNERPTIATTNSFMQKYYGEVPRHPDAHGWLDPSKIDIKGTRGWDWNDNFGSSAMVPMSNNISNLSVFDQFKDLSEEQANTLEPELNALWQFKENEGMFERQLENLLSETSPNELDPMLETFHETYDSQWSQTLENKNTIQPEIVPETGPVPLPQ